MAMGRCRDLKAFDYGAFLFCLASLCINNAGSIESICVLKKKHMRSQIEPKDPVILMLVILRIFLGPYSHVSGTEHCTALGLCSTRGMYVPDRNRQQGEGGIAGNCPSPVMLTVSG